MLRPGERGQGQPPPLRRAQGERRRRRRDRQRKRSGAVRNVRGRQYGLRRVELVAAESSGAEAGAQLHDKGVRLSR
jgi:hypothetical protein